MTSNATTPALAVRIVLLVLTVTTAVCAADNNGVLTKLPFDVDNPPQGVIQDQYFAVMLLGKKCGYARMALKREDDTMRSLNYVRLQVARGSGEVVMVIKQVTSETIDGEPVSFETESFISGQTIHSRGTFRDGLVTMTTEQQGRTTTNEVQIDPATRMPWAEFLAMVQHGLRVGTEYELKSFSPMLGSVVSLQTSMKVEAQEQIDLFGRTVEAYRIVSKTMTDAGMTVGGTSWVDMQGMPLKVSTQVGMFKLTLLACSQAVAKLPVDPPELFESMLISVPGGLDASARAITYTLTGADDVPETAMQRIIERADDKVLLQVRVADVSGGDAGGHVYDESDLAASTFCDITDPVIRELADKAAGRADTPVDMVRRMVRFVSRHVESKNLNVGFATAGEVARSGSGDCSEHAVLLAALARAKDIPARGVCGLAYVGRGANGVFGYHMWTQVFLNGQWVDVDATFNQFPADATHITLGILDLSDEHFVDQALSLVGYIGQVGIEKITTDSDRARR